MRRVLILEQEAFLGALLSERFQRSGFKVDLLASTPPEMHAYPYTPDLIIVGTHERDTLQQLYKQAPTTPVIVLGEQRHALPTWLFPTLGKPFSPNQLVALANRYLLARKLHHSSLKISGDIRIIPIS